MSSDKLDSRNITINKDLKESRRTVSPNTDSNCNYTPDSPEISPSIYELVSTTRHQSESIHSNSSHSHDGSDARDNTEVDIPREYHLFPNQVAGTLPMLHSDGLLYKPLKTDLEHKFYTHILSWLPSIKPFIPKYCGMEEIKIQLQAQDNDDHDKMNNEWSCQMFKKHRHRIRAMPFLILEDLTLKYAKPNILDLKIGIRHFPPVCSKKKMDRKLRKSWCSTCRHFGVRMSGIQTFNNKQQKYHIMAKNQAMRLPKDAFCKQICSFFDLTTHKTLTRFIQKLTQIKQILKDEHRFRWFSCSLLFVYEGQMNEHEEHKTANGDHEDDDEHDDMIDLKLIDFTNFVVIENYKNYNHNEENESRLQLNGDWDNLDEADHGLLFGLECLIQLLSEMKCEGAIKMRNEKEWHQFSQSISHAKKALLPFENKEEFNEHTTI
eukprot:261713_1